MNEQEENILTFNNLSTHEQERYITEHPFLTLAMFWYLIGYTGIIDRLKEEQKGEKGASQ